MAQQNLTLESRIHEEKASTKDLKTRRKSEIDHSRPERPKYLRDEDPFYFIEEEADGVDDGPVTSPFVDSNDSKDSDWTPGSDSEDSSDCNWGNLCERKETEDKPASGGGESLATNFDGDNTDTDTGSRRKGVWKPSYENDELDRDSQEESQQELERDGDEEGSKAKMPRRLWSEDEIKAVKRHLSYCIVIGRVPKMDQAKKAIAAEPCLKSRSWQIVKDFVYNLIKKQKRNKI